MLNGDHLELFAKFGNFILLLPHLHIDGQIFLQILLQLHILLEKNSLFLVHLCKILFVIQIDFPLKLADLVDEVHQLLDDQLILIFSFLDNILMGLAWSLGNNTDLLPMFFNIDLQPKQFRLHLNHFLFVFLMNFEELFARA
jgi:hypothetical protein